MTRRIRLHTDSGANQTGQSLTNLPFNPDRMPRHENKILLLSLERSPSGMNLVCSSLRLQLQEGIPQLVHIYWPSHLSLFP